VQSCPKLSFCGSSAMLLRWTLLLLSLGNPLFVRSRSSGILSTSYVTANRLAFR
jgi:hypothetical protein